MTSDHDRPFDFIADGVALSIEFKGIDYVFSSQVIGKLKRWLVIAKDPAMETFDDLIFSGCRLKMRFVSGGLCCQVDALLKRILSDGTAALVIERPGDVERIERRSQPRWECHFPARMEVRKQAKVVITNINTKGCRLRWSAAPRESIKVVEGDRVHLEAVFPGYRSAVLIQGEVRNIGFTEDHVEAGILFDGPFPELPDIIGRLKTRL